MSIKEKIEQLKFIEDDLLLSKFGVNVHYVDITENIQTGVVDRLMNARKLDIPYAVVLRDIANFEKSLRQIITTYDIETIDKDEEQEIKNIYAFLAGEKDKIKSKNEFEPLISNIGRKK